MCIEGWVLRLFASLTSAAACVASVMAYYQMGRLLLFCIRTLKANILIKNNGTVISSLPPVAAEMERLNATAHTRAGNSS